MKYVVDAWKTVQAPVALEARLITLDDLENNLGYFKMSENTAQLLLSSTVPNWVYNSSYYYWTMSQGNDNNNSMWSVTFDGDIQDGNLYSERGVVRPVITIQKSSISA